MNASLLVVIAEGFSPGAHFLAPYQPHFLLQMSEQRYQHRYSYLTYLTYAMTPYATRPTHRKDHLELLHFYTTATSLALSNRPELQQIWQQVVPRIAFTHPFLLHVILAFSALHLARSEPERKALLYTETSAHHDIGLRMFRIAMANITPENCDACFAFSSIIAAYAWASSD
jgi:hypothetical protein